MKREVLVKKIIDIDYLYKRLSIPAKLGLANEMEMTILQCLMHSNGMSVTDIANYIHASLPNVSRALRVMGCDGKIERRVDECDKRNTIINITKIGKEYYEENERKINKFREVILNEFSIEELQVYLCVLEKLYKITVNVIRDNSGSQVNGKEV